MGTWYDWSIHASWAAHAWLVARLSSGRPSAAFDQHGFVTGVIPAAQVDACVAMVRASRRIVMHPDDHAGGFRRSEKIHKVADTLNEGHRYFLPEEPQREPLRDALRTMAPAMREAMGSDFRIVNTRILETLPAAQMMGPNAWHGDGFPPAMLKVMLYLTPPGRDTGTTEFRQADGTTTMIEGLAGSWVLFRNSVVIHRGFPPVSAIRLAIEFTLVPALRAGLEPIFAGLNATYPEYPWSLNPLVRGVASLIAGSRSSNGASPPVAAAVADAAPLDKAARAAQKAQRGAEKGAAAAAKNARAAQELRQRRRRQRRLMLVNRILPPIAVNIGGGAEFVEYRWLNLEGTPGPANPEPFYFDPACRFPLRNGSVDTVYSSHCLEHLDDPTVTQVLREARRVIRGDGRLVIKLPDFDRALAAWRAGDPEFFDADRWGLHRLIPLWERRQVVDSLDARAAMVFCGFWNDAYGDHFSARLADANGYHGPPVMPPDELRAIADQPTPHAVAAALRAHVVGSEPSYHFNHQNAWSRDELRALLARERFEVITCEADEVIAAAADVPGIAAARSESVYCLARPRG